jgi:hypothetical protein
MTVPRRPAGQPRKASQRRRKQAQAPLPPAFVPGDRVSWDGHQGEVLTIMGDEVLCSDGGKRWRLPITSLQRG